MDRERRGGIVVGGLLIAVGALFLAGNAAGVDIGAVGWPLFIIVPGIILFATAFAIGGKAGSGPAVAGAIVTTVGLILAVQAATGLYATWAYAWALVAPTSVGLALVVYGTLVGERGLVKDGLPTLGVGLALFFGFGVFFEGVIGLSGERVAGLKAILPIGLVAIGVILVLGGVRRSRAG
jgi:hypothetical protein